MNTIIKTLAIKETPRACAASMGAGARKHFPRDAVEIIASTVAFVLTNLQEGVQCGPGSPYIF